MKTKFPNTSILSLLTQTINGEEKLLFIYLKSVSDFYPLDKKIHWYDRRGKDGKAITVWTSLSIKQWVACGKDSDIALLFDDILTAKKMIINNTEVLISIPSFIMHPHDNNPFKNRGETKFDSLLINDYNQIPLAFFEKENLKILSGYKVIYNDIKPIFPLGFFEQDFIYENLKKDVFGIKEYRTPYLTFHGVRKTSVKGTGSKEIVGFFQQNFENSDASMYHAVIKNENSNEIGKTVIDKTSGFFKMALTEPTKQGTIEILNNDQQEKAIEYFLLQNIEISVNTTNTTFNDAYNRKFMIASENKTRPLIIKDFTWQRNVYANIKEANQQLSDKFKYLFDYLGPKILIADPYYIGCFKQNPITKEYSSSDCQMAFINAMLHSAVERNIKEITILGFNSIANQHFDKNDQSDLTKAEQRFERYEHIFKRYIKSCELQSHFPKNTIIFSNAKEDFHSRYWFSITENNGVTILDKCVIITNSIGNMNEVDLMPVSDDSQLKQITRKYTSLFKNAEVKLSI